MQVNTLKLESISKSFDKKIIFKETTLEFFKGKIYAIIGKNGSGKSTFVKCLSGVNKFSSGKVYINNKIYNPDSFRYKINISISFQHTYLSSMEKPLSAIYKYVKYFKKIKKNDILYYFDLFEIREEDRNKKLYQLSGGTQKKIEIIKTILTDSPVMVFDEPLSGLDKDVSNIFLSLIKNLPNKNKILILVSHSREIEKIADVVLSINNKKIEEKKMPDEIIFTFTEAIDRNHLQNMINSGIILDYEILRREDNKDTIIKDNLKNFENIIKQQNLPENFKIVESEVIELEDGETIEDLLKKRGLLNSNYHIIRFDNNDKTEEVLFRVENKNISLNKILSYFTENNINYKNIKIL